MQRRNMNKTVMVAKRTQVSASSIGNVIAALRAQQGSTSFDGRSVYPNGGSHMPIHCVPASVDVSQIYHVYTPNLEYLLVRLPQVHRHRLPSVPLALARQSPGGRGARRWLSPRQDTGDCKGQWRLAASVVLRSLADGASRMSPVPCG